MTRVTAATLAALLAAAAPAQFGPGAGGMEGLDPQTQQMLLDAQAQADRVTLQQFEQMQALVQPMSLAEMRRAPGSGGPVATERVDFGALSVEVPRGWQAEAALGNLATGAVAVRAWDAAGRHELRYLANWDTFHDLQTGGYQPGNRVLENVSLPAYAQEIAQSGYRVTGVIDRSENRREVAPTDAAMAAMGISVPTDSGELTFGILSPSGETLVGQAHAQTQRISELVNPMTGRVNGSFSVPVIGLAVSPQDAESQRLAREAWQHMRASVVLSQEFIDASLQAQGRTAQTNREINQMQWDSLGQQYRTRENTDEWFNLYIRR